jgi:hypothetical protein
MIENKSADLRRQKALVEEALVAKGGQKAQALVASGSNLLWKRGCICLRGIAWI